MFIAAEEVKTICQECTNLANPFMSYHDWHCTKAKVLMIDTVTGTNLYETPADKNRGNCADFARKAEEVKPERGQRLKRFFLALKQYKRYI